jgi:hypothetical protein
MPAFGGAAFWDYTLYYAIHTTVYVRNQSFRTPPHEKMSFVSRQRNGEDSLTGHCRQQLERFWYGRRVSSEAQSNPDGDQRPKPAFTAWWVAPGIVSKQPPSARYQSKKSIWRPMHPPHLGPSNLLAPRISLPVDPPTH